jgi:LmbE family N-acetylglucosaminyl deacetylase
VDNGLGAARRLLAVFAHPDDEVLCAGGTMARGAEAGAEIMIVSATRGERGQIRDPDAATRRTLGAVREGELHAAAAGLGVARVRVLAYPDGALASHRSSLGAEITQIMRQFDPDTVITFGADGGYGHPDHATISQLTTATFRALLRGHDRGQRLYHAVFPPQHTSMAEELAHWITDTGQRATDRSALRAITLFATESATMRLARDDVRVEWFPPGTSVVEKGEPANALYLILTGTADRLLEQPGGRVTLQRRMRAGDFFGELGLLAGKRPAHVVARDSLTCLVLSRTPVTPYAGRGAGATSAAGPPPAAAPPETCAVDVTSYLDRKLHALARHRTQYPIVPSMLPRRLLERMLGTEFFRHIADDSPDAVISRRRRRHVPCGQRSFPPPPPRSQPAALRLSGAAAGAPPCRACRHRAG